MFSGSSVSIFEGPRRLAGLSAGTRGVVRRVVDDRHGRAERLAALGVTPGAVIVVLQTFPGIVFQCDETEMAVEPAVAKAILVDVEPAESQPIRRPARSLVTPEA
jgi:Fe2+ transport system protein FeoA